MSAQALEHVLEHADQRIVVLETGATLLSYVADGRELLDPPSPGEPNLHSRGVVLVPWPNRIRDGVYTWDGEEHRLPITEHDKQTALHVGRARGGVGGIYSRFSNHGYCADDRWIVRFSESFDNRGTRKGRSIPTLPDTLRTQSGSRRRYNASSM